MHGGEPILLQETQEPVDAGQQPAGSLGVGDGLGRVEVGLHDLAVVGKREGGVGCALAQGGAGESAEVTQVLTQPAVRDPLDGLGYGLVARGGCDLAIPGDRILAGDPGAVDLSEGRAQQAEGVVEGRAGGGPGWVREGLRQPPEARRGGRGQLGRSLDARRHARQSRSHHHQVLVPPLAGAGRQDLEVLEPQTHRIRPYRRLRGLLDDPRVDVAVDRQGLRPPLVAVVVVEVAGRSPVDVGEGLRPAGVAVVHLAQQLLGAATDPVPARGDVEEHQVLTRDDHLNSGLGEVRVERPRRAPARTARACRRPTGGRRRVRRRGVVRHRRHAESLRPLAAEAMAGRGVLA